MRINPINFFERELDHRPPHFTNMYVERNEADVEKIRRWIYENCSGRFSITKDNAYDTNKTKTIKLNFALPNISFSACGRMRIFYYKGELELKLFYRE